MSNDALADQVRQDQIDRAAMLAWDRKVRDEAKDHHALEALADQARLRAKYADALASGVVHLHARDADLKRALPKVPGINAEPLRPSVGTGRARMSKGSAAIPAHGARGGGLIVAPEKRRDEISRDDVLTVIPRVKPVRAMTARERRKARQAARKRTLVSRSY